MDPEKRDLARDVQAGRVIAPHLEKWARLVLQKESDEKSGTN